MALAELQARRSEVLATIFDRHWLIAQNWTPRDGCELKSAEEESYELLITNAARLVDEGVMEPECILSCRTAAQLILDLREHLGAIDVELAELDEAGRGAVPCAEEAEID